MPDGTVILKITAEYRLCRTAAGTEYLQTDCVGGCKRPYRLDENHSDFGRIRDMLDGGDRSALRCYHKAR